MPRPIRLPANRVILISLGVAELRATILPPALYAALEAHLTLEANGHAAEPEIAGRLLAKLQALKA